VTRQVFELAPPRLVDEPGPAGSALREALSIEESSSREAAAWDRLESRLNGARQWLHRPTIRLVLSAGVAVALAVAVVWLGWAGHLSRPDASVPSWAADEAAAPPLVVPGREHSLLIAGRSRFPDGSVVILSEGGSASHWAPQPGKTNVELSRGSVQIEVVPQPAGRQFEVLSVGYRFRVVGTRFRLLLDGDTSRLRVGEGRVAVFAGDEQLALVQAGQSWQGPRRDRDQPHDGARSSRDPHPDSAQAEPHAGQSADCLELARRGEHSQALSCFESQAAGSDMTAEVAQYELARLRRNLNGDPAGALQALRDYTRRFPGGAFRTEAEVSIVELLASMGRDGQALAESERLLRTGLARERAADLRLLRARIYHRRLDDCGRAEQEYARVGSLSGSLGGQAQLGRARCLERLGRRAEAMSVYRSYLGSAKGRDAEAARERLEILMSQSLGTDKEPTE
jgi:hypothetical protein